MIYELLVVLIRLGFSGCLLCCSFGVGVFGWWMRFVGWILRVGLVMIGFIVLRCVCFGT